MKKFIGCMLSVVMLLLAGCQPNPDPDPAPDSGKDTGNAPVLTKAGAYLDKTVIEMRTSDNSLLIYFTLDGTEPSWESSEEYNDANPPRMDFSTVNEVTVKALAAREDGSIQSKVSSCRYTKLAIDDNLVSQAIKDFANEIVKNSDGATANNPIKLKPPASLTLDDLKIEIPNPEVPGSMIVDGLGGLFIALSGKYVELDLSDVNWLGPDGNDMNNPPRQIVKIPYCHFAAYQTRVNRDKLLSVKFPRDLVMVEANAFRNVSGIKKLDFSGCSKLETIDEYAFEQMENLEVVDFSGCQSLEIIEQYAFSRNLNLRELDFSQTKLRVIRNNAFQHAYRLRYVEFPVSLTEMGDYAFQYLPSLDYIRYRTENFRPYISWANWLYWYYPNEATADKFPARHRIQIPELQLRDATGKNFVIFSPDTPYWSSGYDNLFYFNSGASYHHGQNVRLPVSTDPDFATVDKLRGDALLNHQERFRGLSSVPITFTGLKDKDGNLVTGKIVATALTGSEPVGSNGNSVQRIALGNATITNGDGSITIEKPTGTLQKLDSLTGQALTGRYSRKVSDPSIKWNKTFPGDDWVVNGRSGYDGEPQFWPDEKVEFAVLELEIQDASNNVIGYPERYAESNWLTRGEPQYKKLDIRTVRYVWVSEGVTIYRRNKPQGDKPTTDGQNGVCNVFITLKAGWNLWDVAQWWTNKTVDEYTDADRDVGHTIINVISCGKIPWQDITKTNDDWGMEPSPNAQNPVTWKDIPWVLKETAFKYPD